MFAPKAGIIQDIFHKITETLEDQHKIIIDSSISGSQIIIIPAGIYHLVHVVHHLDEFVSICRIFLAIRQFFQLYCEIIDSFSYRPVIPSFLDHLGIKEKRQRYKGIAIQQCQKPGRNLSPGNGDHLQKHKLHAIYKVSLRVKLICQQKDQKKWDDKIQNNTENQIERRKICHDK